jgi:hypothetical protein
VIEAKETATPRAGRRLRDAFLHAAHIFGLSGFAVAQPIFDVLGRNSTFFAAHGSTRTTLIVFMFAVLLTPATVAFVLALAASVLSQRLGTVVRGASFGILAAIAITSPIAKSFDLRARFALPIFIVCAISIGYAYARATRVRRFASWLIPAPILFAAVFIFGSQATSVLFPKPAIKTPSRAQTPLHVVLIVLDELPLGSLLTPDEKIDGRRFPNFGKLAQGATWYPNATTNAIGTHVSLPTLLTGILPRWKKPGPDKPPNLAAYPNNLFTLLPDSYRMNVDQYVTDLCPPRRCGATAPGASKAKVLLGDVAVVYLHKVLPHGLALTLPRLEGRWAGFLEDPGAFDGLIHVLPGPFQGVVRLVGDFFADEGLVGEPRRFIRWMERIDSEPAGSLDYVHLKMPHTPWMYLPDLRSYNGIEVPGRRPIPGDPWEDSQDLVDAARQRHLLQLQASDTLLGTLMTRLQSQRMFDKSLIVVLSDHGAAFIPGQSKRHDNDTNRAEILRIPLIVKYPGQETGRVDPRNAEPIDLVDTIAGLSGIRIPWRTDGASLLGPDPRRRSRRLMSTESVVTFGQDVPDTRSSIDRIHELFGAGGKQDDLFGFGPHRSLVGQPAPTGRRTGRLRATLAEPELYRHVETSGSFVPARLVAEISGGRPPQWVAVALNGTIAGVGQPFRSSGRWQLSIMLAERHFREGSNRLAIFAVRGAGQLERIRIG